MPAPFTPGLTAAQEAELVSQFNQLFNVQQAEALLRAVNMAASSDSAVLADLEDRVAVLEAVP